jgi:hypothetical protein
MTDPTTLPDVVSVGQRRRPGGVFPTAGGGGGGNTGDPPGRTIDLDPGDPEPPSQEYPCANPDTVLPWNADAAAAMAVKALKEFATNLHPEESGFNERKYGVVLWELPNGSVVAGPMRAGDYTFYEAAQRAAQGLEGRGTVALDWTPPGPGAIVFGSVHTHGMGSFLPSGSDRSRDDQGVLSYTQSTRESQASGRGNQAVLYVAANQPGHYETLGPTKIFAYDESNRDAAIAGDEGAEVNPDGVPCPES